MNIAFCINRLGLVGLAVALTSMVKHCAYPSKLHIWLLCVDISQENKKRLAKILEADGFEGHLTFVDFRPEKIFRSFNPLHGDWTPYGRLLLADYLPVDRVLYLDSDLLIEINVQEVADFDLQGHVLGAVGGGHFRYTLGNRFYVQKLGINPDLEYFNSGVLLFNLQQWRAENCIQSCFEIAKQYPLELPSHDQSLLNILCLGNFAKLPPAFNCEWSADMHKPQVADRMILHFIGSPKPWDPFGSLMHEGYKCWISYWNKDWGFNLHRLSLDTVYRSWMIRRSYVRHLRNRLMQ